MRETNEKNIKKKKKTWSNEANQNFEWNIR